MAVDYSAIEKAAKNALERSLQKGFSDETVSGELALAIARAVSAGIRDYDRQKAHDAKET